MEYHTWPRTGQVCTVGNICNRYEGRSGFASCTNRKGLVLCANGRSVWAAAYVQCAAHTIRAIAPLLQSAFRVPFAHASLGLPGSLNALAIPADLYTPKRV